MADQTDQIAPPTLPTTITLIMTPVADEFDGGVTDTHRRLVTHLREYGRFGETHECINDYCERKGQKNWAYRWTNVDPASDQEPFLDIDEERKPKGYSTIKLYGHDIQGAKTGELFEVTVTRRAAEEVAQ